MTPLLALLLQADPNTFSDLFDQLNQATPLQAWQLLAGAFLPWFAGWLMAQHWTSSQKSWVALGAAALVAIIGCYLTGEFSLALTFAAVFKIAALAWATYTGFWKPTGLAPNISAHQAT